MRSLLAKGFEQVVRFRHFLFDQKVLPIEKIEGVVVVSIGNIACGGTGKTPLVLRLLQDLQLPAALLSRGYKRPFFGKKGSWQEVGDEPFLIREKYPHVQLFVDAHRRRAAKKARASGYKLLILDDGMQHRYLQRDFEIAILDGKDPFGGGAFLPKGHLRDLPSRLDTADLVVTKGPSSLFRPHVEMEVVTRLVGFAPKDKVGVFCGIAKPQQFIETVQALGVEVVDQLVLGDHQRLSEKKLQAFARRAKKRGAKGLLTTEKDRVKLPKDTQVGWVEMELVPAKGKEQWDALVERIRHEVMG